MWIKRVLQQGLESVRTAVMNTLGAEGELEIPFDMDLDNLQSDDEYGD